MTKPFDPRWSESSGFLKVGIGYFVDKPAYAAHEAIVSPLVPWSGLWLRCHRLKIGDDRLPLSSCLLLKRIQAQSMCILNGDVIVIVQLYHSIARLANRLLGHEGPEYSEVEVFCCGARGASI